MAFNLKIELDTKMDWTPDANWQVTNQFTVDQLHTKYKRKNIQQQVKEQLLKKQKKKTLIGWERQTKIVLSGPKRNGWSWLLKSICKEGKSKEGDQ